MAELSLEPYAVVQHWTVRPQGAPSGAPECPPLEALLKEYLETLAAGCQALDGCVIGHIKALALFPNQAYLRASVVAAHLPATLDGAIPPGCTSLDVTLNVLVYGLPVSRAEALTQAAAQGLIQKYPLDIELVRAGEGQHRHEHGSGHE